jgi:hypothetical protein
MIVGVSKLFNFSYLQYTRTNLTWDEKATVRVCAVHITHAQCEHCSSHGTHPAGSLIPAILCPACLV